MKQVIARVISNEEVMSDTCLMWLEASEIAGEAKPGQFVMVRCGEGLELMLRRPISIHQSLANRFALLFRIIGEGTKWLSKRQPKEPLDLLGPLGNGFNIHPDAKNLLLVAGGIGIAPIISLAQEVAGKDYLVTLLYGAKSKDSLYPRQLLPKEIQRRARIITATDDGSAGRNGMVTAILPSITLQPDQIFACGPAAMYQEMIRHKEELLKGKPCQVSLEMRMGCGHGVCFGCTIKTREGLKQACKDGPVFEIDDLIADELVSYV